MRHGGGGLQARCRMAGIHHEPCLGVISGSAMGLVAWAASPCGLGHIHHRAPVYADGAGIGAMA